MHGKLDNITIYIYIYLLCAGLCRLTVQMSFLMLISDANQILLLLFIQHNWKVVSHSPTAPQVVPLQKITTKYICLIYNPSIEGYMSYSCSPTSCNIIIHQKSTMFFTREHAISSTCRDMPRHPGVQLLDPSPQVLLDLDAASDFVVRHACHGPGHPISA